MVVSTTRMTPRAKTLISKLRLSRKPRNARLHRAGDRIRNVRRPVDLPPRPIRATTLSGHLLNLREISNRQPFANAHEYASFSDRTIANTGEIASDGGAGPSEWEISPVSRSLKRKPFYENVTESPLRNKRPALRRTPSPSLEEITS